MSWDVYSKLLLKDCPQDFVTYFAPGARYVRMRESQLQTREDGPFDPRELRSDSVLEAEYEDLPFLIDVEWQSSKDTKMDERLLGYSYEATRLHELPVLSCVIYTQEVSSPPLAPLKRMLPYGRSVLWFDYDSLDLSQQTVEQLRKLNLDGFLPLMLLCKDGATYSVLEEVLTLLEQRKRKELLSLARFYAGKVFKAEGDQERLERRFAMLRDYLEDSWTFQETLEEGREKGRVEEACKNIEAMVQARFPDLLALVRSRIAFLTDLAKLQQVLITIGTAQTAEEVEESLLALR